MYTDFLIIGQGLAGSLLAWQFLKRGKRVMVIDNGRENASSVAAGIINPVTGMRLVKSFDTDRLLPCAKQCYGELSTAFGQQFYFEKAMVRILQSEAERAYAEQRLQNHQYRTYLGRLSGEARCGEFKSPYGYLEQTNTGYLNTHALLTRLKHYLRERGSYRLAEFDYQLTFNQDTLVWRDVIAKRVIFCEGYGIAKNPWFSWLPLQPAKGQILTLTHNEPLTDVIYKFGNWLLPIAPGKVRLGATFEHGQIDILPTSAGKECLLANLYGHHPGLAQAQVADHQAGIRPCTLDKQPFLGQHPRFPRLAVFNGFGAKGSLQAPWYSQIFANFLIKQTPLPAICASHRYEATHFPR